MITSPPRRIVLAITGASGAPYAIRLLQVLAETDLDVHLTISPSGAAVIDQELGLNLDLQNPNLSKLLSIRPAWAQRVVDESAKASPRRDWLHYHRHNDFMTPIASGSFLTEAMVICPCSGSTLAGIAHSSASNLIQRAAEVHLKEHRKLIIVPRETPVSVLQLENMHRLAAAGVVVLPAMPGWYQPIQSIEDLVDFVVARILDQLGVINTLMHRWKG